MTRAGHIAWGVTLAVAAIASAIGQASPAFLRAYLIGWLLWLVVALGAFSLLCLYHLVGGRWGATIEPLLAAATRTLPLLAALFLPLGLGLERLYPWTDPAYLQAEPLRAAKAPFLAAGPWLIRSVVTLVGWSVLGGVLARARRPRPGLAAFSLIVYFVTITTAGVDWVLSLDANMSTSAIGLHLATGNALAGLAAVVVAAAAVQGRSGRAPLVPTARVHDLGTLLFVALMLWGYIAFSQFLIIWSGDLPHQASWLLRRTRGPWTWVSWGLIVVHAAALLSLLLRPIKRDLRRLAAVAAGLLAMRYVELAWLIVPTSEIAPRFHWLDVAVPLGLGALWIAALLLSWMSADRPLLVVAPEDTVDV